jgi:hypothetical protein
MELEDLGAALLGLRNLGCMALLLRRDMMFSWLEVVADTMLRNWESDSWQRVASCKYGSCILVEVGTWFVQQQVSIIAKTAIKLSILSGNNEKFLGILIWSIIGECLNGSYVSLSMMAAVV